MRQTKNYTLIPLGLLLLFLLASQASANDVVEITEIDFTSGDITVHEVTFDVNEGTVVTVQPDGSIDIKVLEVTNDSY